MGETRIGYISEGKLFLLPDPDAREAPPREVVSRFAQEMLDRDERRRQKDHWKRGSAGWNTSGLGGFGMGLGSAFANNEATLAETRHVNIVSAAALDSDKMLYALETDAVGGLFEYEPATDSERRLAHRTDFRLSDLDAHPISGRIAFSLMHPDGCASLAVMEAGGGRLTEITEGDSVDQAASWVGGDHDKLIYQSAGLARSADGFVAEVSPYRIEQLDLISGEHDVLFATDHEDFLMPRRLLDGTTYFIRRPYKPMGSRRLGPWPIIKDTLLFPIRLCIALFAFLNMFSLMFAKKPLTTATGPKVQGPRQRDLFLYGRRIEGEKARQAAQAESGRAVVPHDWQLVRVDAEQRESVLATGVGHYALLPGGDVVYTDGSTVFRLTPQGDKKTLVRQRMVERVVVLGG